MLSRSYFPDVSPWPLLSAVALFNLVVSFVGYLHSYAGFFSVLVFWFFLGPWKPSWRKTLNVPVVPTPSPQKKSSNSVATQTDFEEGPSPETSSWGETVLESLDETVVSTQTEAYLAGVAFFQTSFVLIGLVGLFTAVCFWHRPDEGGDDPPWRRSKVDSSGLDPLTKKQKIRLFLKWLARKIVRGTQLIQGVSTNMTCAFFIAVYFAYKNDHLDVALYFIQKWYELLQEAYRALGRLTDGLEGVARAFPPSEEDFFGSSYKMAGLLVFRIPRVLPRLINLATIAFVCFLGLDHWEVIPTSRLGFSDFVDAVARSVVALQEQVRFQQELLNAVQQESPTHRLVKKLADSVVNAQRLLYGVHTKYTYLSRPEVFDGYNRVGFTWPGKSYLARGVDQGYWLYARVGWFAWVLLVGWLVFVFRWTRWNKAWWWTAPAAPVALAEVPVLFDPGGMAVVVGLIFSLGWWWGWVLFWVQGLSTRPG